MQIYTIGSLFSGVGGIELGFEKEGFKTAWMIEVDDYARAILKKRFPEATLYGDVTKIDFNTVPKVDILTGGFPCTDISNAGKRAGITGRHSSLWKYYRDAIRNIRPKYALIENVSALSDRGLNVVLADLAEIRYDAEWYNISASAVGAFHRRERMFIIAYPNSSGHIHGQIEKQSAERREPSLSLSLARGTTISDTNNKRWERRGETEIRFKKFSKQDKGMWCVEPRICRVADGIPHRVDRIRCLGNAVVPQVAQVFAQAIKERLIQDESIREDVERGK